MSSKSGLKDLSSSAKKKRGSKRLITTSVPQVPPLPIAQAFFQIQVQYKSLSRVEDAAQRKDIEEQIVCVGQELFNAIRKYKMAAYLGVVRDELRELMGEEGVGRLYLKSVEAILSSGKVEAGGEGSGAWPESLEGLQQALEASNQQDLREYEQRMEEEKEDDENEYCNYKLKRAEYYAQVGDYKAAIREYNEVIEHPKTMTEQKMYAMFGLLLLGLFYTDNKKMSGELMRAGLNLREQFEKTEELVDKKGDWDRRNRLRAYRCVWKVWQREFAGAAQLFLDTIATYESEELMTMGDFVEMGSLVCGMALGRPELKKRVVESPEFTREAKIRGYLNGLLGNLYYCHYDKFFLALAEVETRVLKLSRYWYPHRGYYVREMRIRAYAQLLESYRFIKLETVALKFGVSEEFIERDLARFIVGGRLHFTIDKVKGTVVNNRPDIKNQQYAEVIKQGDELLNRIQTLSRIIHI
ncbi:proteasome regulatory particle subunit [Spiromyces aspiralis]|uniref:Proteasome regulatory particle subunit n=1 Tax=Spiromyces aspiralis TaxID=68401 RepID=A0ACC1HTB5_9FUNG|nr:proteasome regulatory particle subunit [Spiromyces aspiralis]